MKQIHGFLIEYLKKSPQLYSMPQGKLLDKWPLIVGDFLAEHIQPTSFKKGVLECLVSHSTLIQEKKYLAPEILKKIQAYPEGKWVKELKFSVLSKESFSNDSKHIVEKHQKYETVFDFKINKKLTLNEIKDLEQSTSAISDNETQTKLLKLFKSMKIKQKSLLSQGWKICEECKGLYAPSQPRCYSCELSNQ